MDSTEFRLCFETMDTVGFVEPEPYSISHFEQTEPKNGCIPLLKHFHCSRSTVRLEIVETIPENLSFGNVKLPRTTYSAWLELIDKAERSLSIAAYKSSLQGKHVLGNLSVLYSKEVTFECFCWSFPRMRTLYKDNLQNTNLNFVQILNISRN